MNTPAGSVPASAKLEKVKGRIPKMRRVPGRARLTPMMRFSLRRASYHEAGHYIALRSFGVHGMAHVLPTGRRGQRAFTGWVEPLSPLPPRADAVVSWAGPLAECLFHERDKDPRQLLRDPQWLDYGYFAAWFRASDSDRRGIKRHPRDRRTFLAAARVLLKWLDNLKFSAWLFYGWAHTAEERPELVVPPEVIARLNQP